jgi:transposase
LWNDEDLREVCDIEENEKPYHPSQLTNFRDRVGVERLEKILNSLIDELMKANLIVGKQVVFDATFVKAYSKRDLTITAKALQIRKREQAETVKPMSSATSCTWPLMQSLSFH